MTKPYTRAPHASEAPSGTTPSGAPNAALLIDFDNVTMGMRSDLSKELKTLLNSDVIRGKVTVQRAYADWRRYPQYIVPLSEASVDLIFAPAYGSSKKNATDIRMAIDALELIFIRPEIGTYILLTGDSDFSSLVLKLKEYGKYVIGVGIQESSSDILVQNCDEYYSYTALSGLRKTTEAEGGPVDPWVLVEKSLERMERRNDVMRSDRLKQVMLEIDPGFDEGSFGFSKFSRFITEAKSRGLVRLRKLDNGQYEVRPAGGRRSEERQEAEPRSGRPEGGERKTRDRGGRDRRAPKKEQVPERKGGGDPLKEAYQLLESTVARLVSEDGKEAVRDSDVKRKMLERDRSFDEGELGFSKFSRFLQQAHEHEVIILRKRDSGNYEVTLPGTEEKEEKPEARRETREGAPEAGRDARDEVPASRQAPASDEPDIPMVGAVDLSSDGDEEPAEDDGGPGAAAEAAPAGSRSADESEEPEEETEEERRIRLRAEEQQTRGLRARFGSRKPRSRKEGPPPLFEGQVVTKGGDSEASAGAGRGGPSGSGAASSRTVDPDDLGLPTEPDAMVRYLTNSYKGVGKKTAEGLVETFGQDLYSVLQQQPDRIEEAVPAPRADMVLEGWKSDLERRRSRKKEGGSDDAGGGDPGGGSSGGQSGPSGGRRTRRRGGRGRRGS